jgi:CheY-like chemotaxis protein
MKREPSTADVPVVVLSASVMTSDKEAAAEAGCAAFVEKPILPDDVVALVRRLLAGAAG